MNGFLENIFDKRFFTKDTKKTFNRWVKAMKEFNNFDDFHIEDFTLFNIKSTDINNNQEIECKDIEISSLCSHHLFPFTAKVNISYIPNKVYCGLSKLPRVCFHYSRRPCSQEELTDNIFNYLARHLQPKKLKVDIVSGMHTCSSCRGVLKQVNYNTSRQQIFNN